MDSSLSRGKEREAIATKQTDLFTRHSFESLSSWQQNLYFRILLYLSDSPCQALLGSDLPSIRCALYPLRNDVRDAQLQSALSALVIAGLIAIVQSDDGHQILSLTSADQLGGDYRGDDYYHHRYPTIIVSQPSDDNEEAKESVPSSFSSTGSQIQETGNAELLGITEADITENLERQNEIVAEASASGLSTNSRALARAESLADLYSFEWLIEAIKVAYDCPKPSWIYVEGILRKWRDDGGPEESNRRHQEERSQQTPGQSSMKRRKMTKDQEDEELRKWGFKP